MSDLEIRLESAARSIAVPDPVAFARRVGDGVRSSPRPVVRSYRGPVLAVAALVVVCGLVATVVAPVRSAVADFLGVDGVHITRAAPAPPTSSPPSSAPPTTVPADPVGALHLGALTTLQGAARAAGFAMRLPTAGGYQRPDAVFVGGPGTTPMASMVYLPQAGRPAVDGTGIAALLGEFRGHLEAGYFGKLAAIGTSIESVRIGQVDGYWLSGEPHQFFYVRPDGTVDSDTMRLAGNTLLWSAAGITYRFETSLGRDAAIAIAASMR
jgi:hypothetical protein